MEGNLEALRVSTREESQRDAKGWRKYVGFVAVTTFRHLGARDIHKSVVTGAVRQNTP